MDSTFGSDCLINYNRGKCPVTWDEKVMFLRGFGTHRFCHCVRHATSLAPWYLSSASTPASSLDIQVCTNLGFSISGKVVYIKSSIVISPISRPSMTLFSEALPTYLLEKE